MDRTGYFLLLLVPLLLALLCCGLEVFTLLSTMENRRLADEYAVQTEEGASRLASDSDGVVGEVLSNLTASVKALLAQSEALRREMEMVGISRGNLVTNLEAQLEDILSTLNGTMEESDLEEDEESFSNKTLKLREGCVSRTSTCPTQVPGETMGNYTYRECLVYNRFSAQDGEIVGGTARTGLILGKIVHRQCSIGEGSKSLDFFSSIPSVGSALEYDHTQQEYGCRCYQMSNSTVTLNPILCSFTVTVCNERGTLVV